MLLAAIPELWNVKWTAVDTKDVKDRPWYSFGGQIQMPFVGAMGTFEDRLKAKVHAVIMELKEQFPQLPKELEYPKTQFTNGNYGPFYIRNCGEDKTSDCSIWRVTFYCRLPQVEKKITDEELIQAFKSTQITPEIMEKTEREELERENKRLKEEITNLERLLHSIGFRFSDKTDFQEEKKVHLEHRGDCEWHCPNSTEERCIYEIVPILCGRSTRSSCECYSLPEYAGILHFAPKKP